MPWKNTSWELTYPVSYSFQKGTFKDDSNDVPFPFRWDMCPFSGFGTSQKMNELQVEGLEPQNGF